MSEEEASAGDGPVIGDAPIPLASVQVAPGGSSGDSDSSSWGSVTSLAAGVAAFALLLRMFAVSRWNWHTAADVLVTMDFGNVISIAFGTLIAEPLITGIGVAILFPLAVIDLVWPADGSTIKRAAKVVLVFALGVTYLTVVRTFGDWWLLAITALTAAAVAAPRVYWRSGLGHRMVRLFLNRVGVITAVAALVLAAVIPTPWVPKERITLQDREMEGYVLDVESGYLHVLTSGERRLVIFNDDEVLKRTTLD